MGIKAFLSKPLAAATHRRNKAWMQQPVETQDLIFKQLLSQAVNTAFGREHGFARISSHADYVQAVHVRD